MRVLDSLEMPTLPEWSIFVLAIIAAVATVRARSRLSAIISLGVVGVAVTLFFVFYSAPDLALTQLLIEVLTVILLVLVFFRVKPDPPVRTMMGAQRLPLDHCHRHGAFSDSPWSWSTTCTRSAPSISPYFLANCAADLGKGSNVVNVILVDIRGYDTLGEITVLGLAALGGYAVLRSPQMHALRQRINAAAAACPASEPAPTKTATASTARQRNPP